MNKFHIECLPEEVLMLNLGISREAIQHHPGSGAVCKTLADGTNLLGLIDEDPDRDFQHDYYKKLYQKYESDEHNIRFSIDKAKKNKMIFIKPRFEPWIIEVAKNSGVKMEDFNLSENPDLLHREITFKKSDLQKLFHKLIKVKSPAIKRLQKLINS